MFLRGFSPDFVVTADDDRAVILIGSREGQIGSQEVVDLAAAVALHREWRFELVSTRKSVTLPVALSSEVLDQLLDETNRWGLLFGGAVTPVTDWAEVG